MPLTTAPDLLAERARRAADAAANLAQVDVVEVGGLDRLREVADLFTAVWGPGAEGAPMPSDLLRSLTHAGAFVSAGYRPDGALAGASVAVRSTPGEAYSVIAAVRPGGADRGVGFALKQHQRAWALGEGLGTVRWTFDPLVSRNARFNLTKLGARASEYLADFYGPMGDRINAGDRSDRLVATWSLADPRVLACSERQAPERGGPAYADVDVRRSAPDGGPLLVVAADALWCRCPADVVALRAQDPAAAAAWRAQVRDVLTEAFAAGLVATDVTRTGWYRLTHEEDR